jgi:hypothetical protein
LQGVTVYRDHERKFAQGDRVQMTAPYHEQQLANRELGTVEQIDKNGNLKLKMDSGREVEFNARQHPHLDYGYTVTSHSSQGQTADRVLIHVDSAEAHGELLNSRMAYVSVSRAQFDVKMYTNDEKTLGQELSRDVTKATALLPQQELGEKVKPQSVGIELSQGFERSIKTTLSVPLRYNLDYGRVVKLAATADSKSAEGNLMSVRLRPRPPSTASPQDQCKDSPGWIDPAEAEFCRKRAEIYTFSYPVSSVISLSR